MFESVFVIVFSSLGIPRNSHLRFPPRLRHLLSIILNRCIEPRHRWRSNLYLMKILIKIERRGNLCRFKTVSSQLINFKSINSPLIKIFDKAVSITIGKLFFYTRHRDKRFDFFLCGLITFPNFSELSSLTNNFLIKRIARQSCLLNFIS